MTDRLHRNQAPISQAAWTQIDDEAKRTLAHSLAARALVDFSGPHGWELSAVPLGRVTPVGAEPAEGAQARLRTSQPVVEFRVPFEVPRVEVDAIDRGAPNADLSTVTEAARNAALAEDRAAFHGLAAAGIPGIAPSSPHEPIAISDNYDEYPGAVARAVATLRRSGIGGPYAIALGPRCYTGVIETTEHGGYPLLEHVRLILGGPLIWAPGVDGAVVLSQRGGDYEIVCGSDFAIGYTAHSADTVELYLEESFTLVVKEERAAVALRYPR